MATIDIYDDPAFKRPKSYDELISEGYKNWLNRMNDVDIEFELSLLDNEDKLKTVKAIRDARKSGKYDPRSEFAYLNTVPTDELLKLFERTSKQLQSDENKHNDQYTESLKNGSPIERENPEFKVSRAFLDDIGRLLLLRQRGLADVQEWYQDADFIENKQSDRIYTQLNDSYCTQYAFLNMLGVPGKSGDKIKEMNEVMRCATSAPYLGARSHQETKDLEFQAKEAIKYLRRHGKGEFDYRLIVRPLKSKPDDVLEKRKSSWQFLKTEIKTFNPTYALIDEYYSSDPWSTPITGGHRFAFRNPLIIDSGDTTPVQNWEIVINEKINVDSHAWFSSAVFIIPVIHGHVHQSDSDTDNEDISNQAHLKTIQSNLDHITRQDVLDWAEKNRGWLSNNQKNELVRKWENLHGSDPSATISPFKKSKPNK